jgi:hypothetical protein
MPCGYVRFVSQVFHRGRSKGTLSDMRRFLGLVLTLVLAGVVAMAIAAPGTIPATTVGFTMLVVLVFADAAFIAGPWERVAILALFTGVLGVFVAYAVGEPEDPQEGGWAMGTGFLVGTMAGALLGIAVNRFMTRSGQSREGRELR